MHLKEQEQIYFVENQIKGRHHGTYPTASYNVIQADPENVTPLKLVS